MSHQVKNVYITKLTPKAKIKEIGKEADLDGHSCQYGAPVILPEEITSMADAFGVPRNEFKKEFLTEHELFNTPCFKIKEEKKPNRPYGKCMFYDEEKKRCMLGAAKPFICSVGGLQGPYAHEIALWYTLNYFVNPDDPQSLRDWATYLKTHPTLPGGELHELIPDKTRLAKILSYEEIK